MAAPRAHRQAPAGAAESFDERARKAMADFADFEDNAAMLFDDEYDPEAGGGGGSERKRGREEAAEAEAEAEAAPEPAPMAVDEPRADADAAEDGDEGDEEGWEWLSKPAPGALLKPRK